MTGPLVAPNRDALARWFCMDDGTSYHQDRTDDFPCTACVKKADRALAQGGPVHHLAALAQDEAVLTAVVGRSTTRNLTGRMAATRQALTALAAVLAGDTEGEGQ